MITRFARRTAAVVAIALTCLSSTAWAQATGTIAGVVIDQSGGVLPGVAVEAVSAATAVMRQTVSGADGHFSLPLLQPGEYAVKATLAGFKPVVQEKALVSVGDTTRVDLRLTVGGLSEGVTVRAETPLIETAHATLGITIDHQKLVELPLNGRNFTQLGTLRAGVVVASAGARGRRRGCHAGRIRRRDRPASA